MAGRISIRSIIVILFLMDLEIIFPQTFNWVKQIGSSGTGTNSGSAIDVDQAGNIYVTGSFHDTAVFDGITVESKGWDDMFLAKYSSSGELIWLKTSGAAGLDEGTSLTIDAEGKRVIVAGFMKDAQFEDMTLTGGMCTAKYNTDGECLFAAITGSGSASYPCSGRDIAVSDSRNIFLTGTMYRAVDFGAVKVPINDWESVFIAKLSIDEPTEVNKFSEQAAACILNQNYPNPFNPKTKISFTIPYTSYVTLGIYNLLGEVVATPKSEILSAGTHTVMWDATDAASGVYVYCLQAGNYSDKKKLVVQR